VKEVNQEEIGEDGVDVCNNYTLSLLPVDNYGSFGDDNTSDEDDDGDDISDNDDYESGSPLASYRDPDSYNPEFGVPNTGSLYILPRI